MFVFERVEETPTPKISALLRNLAHRNRSDFCDLRLRCPSRTPEIARFPRQEKAMLHCDLRVRWKVASDLRFRAATSEPKTPSFCGISGDLAPSTRKSLAIAIVRFWCAKLRKQPVLLRANFVLTKDPKKRMYYGHFCGKTHKEGSCSRAAGVLVKSRC